MEKIVCMGFKSTKHHSVPLNSETQREDFNSPESSCNLSFLGKLTLCNEIFISSGNKQNNMFLKALPTSELLHF